MSDPAWEAAERITQLERALAEALVHAEQLEEALMSRDIIGQAKGVLMERKHLDADVAFNELVLQSQRLNENCDSSPRGSLLVLVAEVRVDSAPLLEPSQAGGWSSCAPSERTPMDAAGIPVRLYQRDPAYPHGHRRAGLGVQHPLATTGRSTGY